MKIAKFLAYALVFSIIAAVIDLELIRPYVGIETAKSAGSLVAIAGALWAMNKYLL